MNAKDLIHKNPIYNAIYEQMLGYQYSYLGGYIFKTYVRKKRPSEDSNLYLDLVQNTVAQPICRYIVDTINDVLSERFRIATTGRVGFNTNNPSSGLHFLNTIPTQFTFLDRKKTLERLQLSLT